MHYIRFFFLFFSIAVSSQNLVLNSSFDNAKRCTEFVGGFNSNVSFWSSPTYGTPDLFNSCSESKTGIPYNYNGIQNTFFGNKYAGVYLYTDDNYREYIQGQLISALEKDSKYTMSLYISLAENSDFAIKDIGFLLSAQKIKTNTFTELSEKTLKKLHITKYSVYTFDTTQFHDNKKDWVLLEMDFYASGAEKFVTIGNFNKNSRTPKHLVSDKNRFNMSYYYIDLVSIAKTELGEEKAIKSISETDKIIEKIQKIELDKEYIFKNVVFEFNSFELSNDAKSEIIEVYQYLKENDNTKIIISGHTDAVGSTTFNQRLSEKRAYSVVRFFKSLGLKAERIHSISYGSSKPISTNTSEDGRNKNRRVEFKIERSN